MRALDLSCTEPLRSARTAPRRAERSLLFALLLALAAPAALVAQSAAEPPTSPPDYWGPISINLEEIEYPYPVQFLERELFGETVRLAYMDVAPTGEPNGRTVYLTHGMSYYGLYWGETMRVLADAGYRVIAEDRLGWGKSSKPLIPYSWHLHAENKIALMDHLGIDQVAIIGHSMGGYMASRFARLYPERTTHMAMVNPIGLGGDPRPAPMEAVTRAEIPQEPEPGPVSTDRQLIFDRHIGTETRRVVEWEPEFLEHVRIRFGNDISDGGSHLAAVRTANQTGDSMVGDWPLIQVPSLVIGGEEDGPNFPAQMRRAAEMLPKGELVLFPNVGHNPHLEAPELLNRELLRFLATE